MDSLLIRTLPRALCICYWLRTCKCPLLTSWGQGWQILPGAELCTLKLMLCSSRPDPRSHSLLSKGLLELQPFPGTKHKAGACPA